MYASARGPAELYDVRIGVRFGLSLGPFAQSDRCNPGRIDRSGYASERNPIHRLLRSLYRIVAHHVLGRLHESLALIFIDCKFWRFRDLRQHDMQSDE